MNPQVKVSAVLLIAGGACIILALVTKKWQLAALGAVLCFMASGVAFHAPSH